MIEVKNLNAFYGNKKVLDDININFPKNQLTVILGPNGSGKTTLIKTVLGLIKRESGSIYIEKKEILDMSLKEIALKMSYLSQVKNVPSITTEKMVLHGRFPHLGWPRKYSKKDFQIVNECMEKADCENLKGRLMTDLSGGERQKVYIAMAMAQDTDTIFMDEPTTYLDLEHQISIMKRTKELCNDGKTVVMVLHDLALALKNANFIVVMKDGKIMEKGSVEKIYSSGILENVFNVKICRIQTSSGFHYWAEA